MTVALSLSEKCSLLPRVPPRLVARAASWLIRPLVDTPASVRRLRRWAATGGFERLSMTREEMRRALPFYGDEQMVDAALDALQLMAPPAREYILRRTAIFGTGWSTHGWTGRFHFPHRPERVIVISGAPRQTNAIRETTLHEFAHAWLELNRAGRRRVPLLTPGDVETLLAAASAEVRAQASALTTRVEARAIALASMWAFRPVETVNDADRDAHTDEEKHR